MSQSVAIPISVPPSTELIFQLITWMNANYCFRDTQSPLSGNLVSLEKRLAHDVSTLQANDYVEVGVERSSPNEMGVRVPIERMWVKIEENHGSYFDGVVHAQTHFSAHHGIRQGDAISFEPRHICDIVWAAAPDAEARMEFSAKVVHLSREFLEEFPDLRSLKGPVFLCALDHATSIQMGLDGDTMVVIIRADVPKELLGERQATRDQYTTAFAEAAKLVGISSSPGKFSDEVAADAAEHLIASVAATTSGHELVSLACSKAAEVRRETRRLLAESSETDTRVG